MMPEAYDPSRPRKCKGRRECRVKAPPMARLRKKCRRQVPQAKPVQPGIPCAMVFTLIRSLPGAPGLLATIAAMRLRALRVIPASGYQDAATSRPRIAVRPHAGQACCGNSAAIAPHLACRDDRALRPSAVRRDALPKHDFRKNERRKCRRAIGRQERVERTEQNPDRRVARDTQAEPLCRFPEAHSPADLPDVPARPHSRHR